MNGVVVVDKHAGCTSFDIVRDVRRILGVKKAGHAGTLDPMATGVLPVCINEATKLVQFFSDGDKEYRATICLGVETDTLDSEGSVIARAPVAVSDETVRAAVVEFVGCIRQQVPRHSAVKHQGKPLYWWTRKGVDVARQSREVVIREIECENVQLPHVTVRVLCSKGTYIRQLAADIGERLGCGAHLAALRRIRSGPFTEADARSIERMTPDERTLLTARVLSISEAASAIPSVVVDECTAKRLRNGVQPTKELLAVCTSAFLGAGDMIKFVTVSDEMVALARVIVPSQAVSSLPEGEPVARIVRVFNETK